MDTETFADIHKINLVDKIREQSIKIDKGIARLKELNEEFQRIHEEMEQLYERIKENREKLLSVKRRNGK